MQTNCGRRARFLVKSVSRVVRFLRSEGCKHGLQGTAWIGPGAVPKTREAMAIFCCTAERRNPKTKEPRKDRNSGATGDRIDSAGQ